MTLQSKQANTLYHVFRTLSQTTPPLPKKYPYLKSNSPVYKQDEGQKSCDEILLLLKKFAK